MNTSRRGSFREKVSHNSTQQRSKAANYGHLHLPRGVNVFKEEAGGRIALDILPYFVTDLHHPDRDDEREIAIEGTLWYRRPYKLHRSIGADNASVVCLGSIGKKCPICEYRAKQLSEGANWQDEAIKAMRPSDRNLYYTVPKGSSKHEEKPYLWDISQFLFQEKLNNELEENEEFGDFPDPEKGLTLRIRFSEEKLGNNSYAETSRIDFAERDYAYDEKLIRDLPSLDEMLDIKDYREVERLFFESDTGDEDEPLPSAEHVRNRQTTSSDERRDVVRSTEHRPAEVTRPKQSPATEEVPTVTTLKRSSRRDAEQVVAREETQQQNGGDENEVPVISRSEPTRHHQTRPAPVEKAGANKCPSGFRFGVDVDTKPECDECPVWSDCMDTHEAAA